MFHDAFCFPPGMANGRYAAEHVAIADDMLHWYRVMRKQLGMVRCASKLHAELAAVDGNLLLYN